ncbi:hypothetical protein [Caballeronia sp. HLA56]
MFLAASAEKRHGNQLISMPEVTAIGKFFNIKNVSRADFARSASRSATVDGFVSSDTEGVGVAAKAAAVFSANEIDRLEARF